MFLWIAVECNAAVANAKKGDNSILLAKPLTYVNASGESVRKLMNKHQVMAGEIITVHDDLDLPLGEVKIKTKGGSGGHKGIDSVVSCLGSDRFSRVRIGIGRPPGRQDPADFVLSDFSAKEEEEIAVAVREAADAVLAIVVQGASAAMNRYNRNESTKDE